MSIIQGIFIWFCVVILSVFLAQYLPKSESDKLTQLEIERTQLEIKILKGECKNDTTKTTTTGL